MTTQPFSRDELAAAFNAYEQTVARAAETRDWNAWVQQYTPDVEYVEHAAGTMRAATRCWLGSARRCRRFRAVTWSRFRRCGRSSTSRPAGSSANWTTR
ncbi:hypothetical protein I553_8390 [Mycobacterium xenopi 4042]|uniref:SnoaL-like domain protein n=1 Tax=Mycobacterium xenopi 4042 TaxID=1299334 RepID=X8BKP8_MYCXE|nr:hypothetical protein I552_8081 [Mycobacterium xenopi 3993]EUA44056.1 hypothetical protein I553_8390 [Mycobacterium xenopi 4042]